MRDLLALGFSLIWSSFGISFFVDSVFRYQANPGWKAAAFCIDALVHPKGPMNLQGVLVTMYYLLFLVCNLVMLGGLVWFLLWWFEKRKRQIWFPVLVSLAALYTFQACIFLDQYVFLVGYYLWTGSFFLMAALAWWIFFNASRTCPESS